MRDWGDIPLGTRVLLDQAPAGARPPAPREDSPGDVEGLLLVSHPAAARELLGSAAATNTTTYFFPSGLVRTGAELERGARGRKLLQRLPPGTRVLVGYIRAGRVARGQSPTQVAGNRFLDGGLDLRNRQAFGMLSAVIMLPWRLCRDSLMH